MRVEVLKCKEPYFWYNHCVGHEFTVEVDPDLPLTWRVPGQRLWIQRSDCRRLDTKDRRKTVRTKRPVQQRKGKICPECHGDKHLFQNGEFARKNCWRCKGTGRLRPVA